MQDELDHPADRLGRSVTVDSPAGRLLGYSVQSDDADGARISTILARRVPDDVRAWQEQHRVSAATGPVRLPANEDLRMSARLCVPLRERGVVRGFLWVVEGAQPLSSAQVEQVVRAGATVLAALPAPTTDGDLSALLEALVDAPPDALPETERLVGAMAEARPDLIGATTCFVVATSRSGRLDPHRRAALRRRLAGPPDVVASVVRPDRVVVLRVVPTGTAPRDDVRALLSTDPLVAGTGPEVAFDATHLLEGLARATFVAGVAAADPRLGPDLGWEQVGAYRWLLEPSSRRSWPAVLAPLSGSDAGEVLLDTLETYLDLAGDAQRTAAALSLHRTTLYYRLHRAAGLLDGDLGDGSWRTDLHLALKGRRLSSSPLPI